MRTLSKLPKYQQIHYSMEYVLFPTYFTISINHPQNTTSDMISVLSGKKTKTQNFQTLQVLRSKVYLFHFGFPVLFFATCILAYTLEVRDLTFCEVDQRDWFVYTTSSKILLSVPFS